MSDFAQQVYDVIRRIPRGRVASYGAVAAVVGRPRAARGVGSILRALPEASDLPWWRVVNGRGEISISTFGHGATLQRTLLEREGVRFDAHGRIDFERHGWQPEG